MDCRIKERTCISEARNTRKYSGLEISFVEATGKRGQTGQPWEVVICLWHILLGKQFQTVSNLWRCLSLESKCCRSFGKMHCALCWYLKWSQPLGVVHRYIWVHPEFLPQRSVVQCLYFPSGEVRRLFGLDLCHCSSAGRGEVFCSVLWNSSQNPLLSLGQPWSFHFAFEGCWW